MSILPEKLPDSIDNAVNNLTNKPTQAIGNFITDLFDLITYSVHEAAEQKRLSVNEKIERFAKERKARLELYKSEIADRYMSIPVENRCEPTEKTLLILKDSEYCLEREEIRELFSNLVAKSLDLRYANNNLIAFSSIVKQLSPIDVKILRVIKKHTRDIKPISCKISYGGDVIKRYIFFDDEIKDIDKEKIYVSVDNLMRLNLLCLNEYIPKVPETKSVIFKRENDKKSNKNEDNDSNIMSHMLEELLKIKNFELLDMETDDCAVEIQVSKFALTGLGREFISFCFND
ncbi:MAG: DUF4393 domain-containing protein [Ruminococcus flavefaciens]|nr:DUF4393 domain-containing protein [Ruminococcus flavefaciens]